MDNGLLAGLAEGVKSGVDAYQTAKRNAQMAAENKEQGLLRQFTAEAELAKQGKRFKKDEISGAIIGTEDIPESEYNPMQQAEMAEKLGKMKEKNVLTPNDELALIKMGQVSVLNPDGTRTRRAIAPQDPQYKYYLKETNLPIKETKVKPEGEDLPIDKKKIVEALSTKNANKISIKNQIDAALSQWDNLSDDQKVATGRGLLKTLNSTEGADAIGVEEAQRLGSKLEFAMGNLFNSNPVQFGRDLPGFKEQASTTAKSIGEAIKSNQGEIDRAMGRSAQQQSFVRVKAPDGSIRRIPKKDLNAALSGGGKLVEPDIIAERE